MLYEINLGAKYSFDSIQASVGGDYATAEKFLEEVQFALPASINYNPENAQAFVKIDYVDSVEEIIDSAMHEAWEKMIKENN